MLGGKIGPTLALLGLALSATGCGKLREVSLCRGLSHDINTAMDQIEALSKAKPPNELKIADRYAELAKTLTPRSLGEQPLALALRDYIAVLRATETAVRSHEAFQRTQSSRIGEPRRELERLVKREHTTLARVEVACHN